MIHFVVSIALAAALVAATPSHAQSPLPGAPDVSRVEPGSYEVDPDHTMVVWTVSHMGVSPLSGAIGASDGTLELDPSDPGAAKVSVSFNIADMTTTVPAFTQHLLSADFFDAEAHPTASFTSTSVEADGEKAKITGDLTLKGITRPITLEAEFFGAGINPMTKKLEIGFAATGRINRSDFGLAFGVPDITPDAVDLRISGAFRRAE